MKSDLACWKCGAALAGLMLPLGQRDQCPSCRADVHACRMCRHFDARRVRQCREPGVVEVKDKAFANACGWFVPRPDAYQGGGAAIWGDF
ncbi:MAG: hypothetical protein ABL892_02210 [Thiobacillaceae bacterium]